MKRLRVILLFLLLGVVVNVAVAWVGYRFSEDSKGMFERWVSTGQAEKMLWSRHAADGWSDADSQYRRWYGLLASGRDMGDFFRSYSIVTRPDMTNAELREVFRGVGDFRVSQINSGFPLRSMRAEEWSGAPDTRFFAATAGHDALDFWGYRLPKRLIWSGFIINTLLYGYLLWLLIPLLYILRCMIRIKHGLCP